MSLDVYVYTVYVYVQGGVINHGLFCFIFSLYRPSCLIKAYDRPEKFRLVCVGLLLIHLFNLNFIFLGSGLAAAAGFADVFHC